MSPEETDAFANGMLAESRRRGPSPYLEYIEPFSVEEPPPN